MNVNHKFPLIFPTTVILTIFATYMTNNPQYDANSTFRTPSSYEVRQLSNDLHQLREDFEALDSYQ
jgi:glycine cleavage system regulatory protein